mmetsp:Transcript_31138/g.88955  ORF Transcript_31138/g.88955 Transcript_31138/m.88955 type:complete len:270 (-) Transcript_31138:513-1322(-)
MPLPKDTRPRCNERKLARLVWESTVDADARPTLRQCLESALPHSQAERHDVKQIGCGPSAITWHRLRWAFPEGGGRKRSEQRGFMLTLPLCLKDLHDRQRALRWLPELRSSQSRRLAMSGLRQRLKLRPRGIRQRTQLPQLPREIRSARCRCARRPAARRPRSPLCAASPARRCRPSSSAPAPRALAATASRRPRPSASHHATPRPSRARTAGTARAPPPAPTGLSLPRRAARSSRPGSLPGGLCVPSAASYGSRSAAPPFVYGTRPAA